MVCFFRFSKLFLCLPADLHVQVSLELQFRDAEALNLTLWGLGNHTSLHLHPPEQEEEEEEDEDRGWNVKKVGGETRAFYCCYPGPASPGSVTRGLCLLCLFNQTALRRAAHNRLLLVDKGGCEGRRPGGRPE